MYVLLSIFCPFLFYFACTIVDLEGALICRRGEGYRRGRECLLTCLPVAADMAEAMATEGSLGFLLKFVGLGL